jgi:hypothetical protein
MGRIGGENEYLFLRILLRQMEAGGRSQGGFAYPPLAATEDEFQVGIEG